MPAFFFLLISPVWSLVRWYYIFSATVCILIHFLFKTCYINMPRWKGSFISLLFAYGKLGMFWRCLAFWSICLLPGAQRGFSVLSQARSPLHCMALLWTGFPLPWGQCPASRSLPWLCVGVSGTHGTTLPACRVAPCVSETVGPSSHVRRRRHVPPYIDPAVACFQQSCDREDIYTHVEPEDARYLLKSFSIPCL